MLISRNLHKKSCEVSIKARSTPASLSFKGQVTRHPTVKWSIVSETPFTHPRSWHGTMQYLECRAPLQRCAGHPYNFWHGCLLCMPSVCSVYTRKSYRVVPEKPTVWDKIVETLYDTLASHNVVLTNGLRDSR